jgi:flagellar basal-body rod modification protein FlgD
MNVGSLSGNAATSNLAGIQTKGKASLTQEDFLNLLVTQMQFQDPMNPLDNYQMAAQLAQLGTIEGINTLTQSIDVMNAYQAATAHLQVVGLIGKKVEAVGNSLILNQGNPAEGSYQLSRAGRVTIDVYDSNGNLVKTLEEGMKDTTKQRFSWDGLNQSGQRVPDGTYSFKVKALDSRGDPISVSTGMMGVVTGISFENGITYVNIGSDKVTLSSIFAILS